MKLERANRNYQHIDWNISDQIHGDLSYLFNVCYGV
jgi:hypothetical protein